MLIDSQKMALRQIADNPLLFEAIKQVFTSHFTEELSDLSITNEQLGEKTRARIDGLNRVNKALTTILSCRTVNQNEIIPNPAR